MNPETAVGYGLVLTVLGIVVLGYGASKLRPVYHVLTNDPIPVRELVYHDGPAEIRGTAATTDEEGTVHAPFSAVDCLACEYEVQELRSSGQSSHWKTLDEGRAAVPFLAEDDTGGVRVDPTGAELHVEEQTVTVPGGEEPPERIARYIRRSDAVDPQHDETVNLVVTELNVGNDQRFVERRLDVGESVHVYGDVDRAPAGEWGAGVVDAVLTRGGDRGILVISDTSERGTAWRMGKGALLWTAGGLALALPGVGFLGYWLVSTAG